MALLSYRSTPLSWCKLSPAELCMGRKLRSLIPQTNTHLIPQWSYLGDFRKANKEFKDKQEYYFNRGHRTRGLSPIPDHTEVWIKSEKKPIPGTVISPAKAPRSYVVETPRGQVERNRSHLNIVPRQESQETTSPVIEVPTRSSSEEGLPSPSKPIMTRSRTGTALQQPEWYGRWQT